MPRIFAPSDDHNFNAGGVPFVNGVAVVSEGDPSLPFFAAAKGYVVDQSKHALTSIDNLPRVTLNGIAEYMGIALVPADGKYEVIRDIETYISAEELGSLTVASAAGTKSGDTKITVTEALGAGNVHKYKVDTIAPAPLYGDEADSTWKALTSGTDITAATGKNITVVECNAKGFILKSGTSEVTAKT